jgi:WD40 repeat protein
VVSLQYAPDMRSAVAACQRGLIVAWRFRPGDSRAIATAGGDSGDLSVLRKSSIEGVTSLRQFALSGDGTLGAVAGANSTINVMKIADDRSVATLGGAVGVLQSLVFVPPDMPLSLHGDRIMRLWDMRIGKVIRQFEVPEGNTGPLRLRASRDGKLLAGLTSDFKTVVLWNVDSGKILWRKSLPDAALSATDVAILSATSQVLVSTTGEVHIFDGKSGGLVRRVGGESANALCCAATSDGYRYATGHDTGVIRIWDSRTDRPMAEVGGHEAPVRAVEFGPDNVRLLSGDEKGDVRLWDFVGKRQLGRSQIGVRVARLEWHGDGSTAAASATGGTYVVWRVAGKTSAPKEVVEAGKRQPIPPTDAQLDAEAKIKEQFKAEYAKKFAPDLRELARKLHAEALLADRDPPRRFVLLREARDLGAAGVDPAQVLAAVEKLSGEYQMEPAPQLVTAFEVLGKQAQTPATLRPVAEGALVALRLAIQGDDPDSAARLIKVADAAARKSSVAALSEAVAGANKQFQRYRTDFEAAKPVLERVHNNVADATAKRAAGMFLCFAKGNWRTGLPLLKAGGEANLQAVVDMELANPSAPATRLALADAWWELAESAVGDPKLNFQRRARYWYMQARGEAAGAERTRCDDRLKSVLGAQNLRSGLVAEFHRMGDNMRLLARTDATVDFNWNGEPAPEVRTTSYSAKWNGWLVAPQAGLYKLIVEADESAVLTIDRRKLIDLKKTGDALLDRTPIRDEAYMFLTEKPVAIRIEMAANFRTFSGRISVRWEPLIGESETVIPPFALYHDRAQGDILPK